MNIFEDNNILDAGVPNSPVPTPVESNSTILNPCPNLDNTNKLIKTKWGNIQGNIEDLEDLIEYLTASNIDYKNIYIQTDNVKEALDIINDKLFYKLPEEVKVTFTASYYRNNVKVTDIYKGMIINKSVYNWTINNYLNNIDLIIFNNNVITTNTYIDTNEVSSNKTSTLKITSNYIDNKGNKPKPYLGSLTLLFKDKQFYWTDINKNNTVSSNKKQIEGNQFDLNTTQLEYIYLMFPIKKLWIHIYEQGGVDPGGIVTEYIGDTIITEYDTGVVYHLYRSINALKGNWTIKYQ